MRRDGQARSQSVRRLAACLLVMIFGCATKPASDGVDTPWNAGSTILRIHLEGIDSEPEGPARVIINVGSKMIDTCKSKFERGLVEVDVTPLLEQGLIDATTVASAHVRLPQYRTTFGSRVQWDHMPRKTEGDVQIIETSLALERMTDIRGRVVESKWESPVRYSRVSVFRIGPHGRRDEADELRSSAPLEQIEIGHANVEGEFELRVPFTAGEHLVAIHGSGYRPILWRGNLNPRRTTNLGVLHVSDYCENLVSGTIRLGSGVLDHAKVRLEAVSPPAVSAASSIGTIRLDDEVYAVPVDGCDLVWQSTVITADYEGRLFCTRVPDGNHRLRLLNSLTWSFKGHAWSEGTEMHPDLESVCTQSLDVPSGEFEFRPNASRLDLSPVGDAGDFEVEVHGERGSWRRTGNSPDWPLSAVGTEEKTLLVPAGRRYVIEYTFPDRAPIVLDIVSPASGETLRLRELASRIENDLPFRRLRLRMSSGFDHEWRRPFAHLIDRNGGETKPPRRIGFRAEEGSRTEFTAPLPPSVHGSYDIVLSTVPDLSRDFYTSSEMDHDLLGTEVFDRFIAVLPDVELSEDGETLLEADLTPGGRALLTVLTEDGRLAKDAEVVIRSEGGSVVFTDDWFGLYFGGIPLTIAQVSGMGITATRLALQGGRYVAEAAHTTDGHGRTVFTITPGADTRVTILLEKQ